MRYRAFVAFAGGGAKGLVHVGALQALEERGVDFRGVAGTSAGAIIAALKASGFSGTELVDGPSGETLMDRLREVDPSLARPVDLFGSGGWPRVWLFRLAIDHPLVALLALLVFGLTWPLASALGFGQGWLIGFGVFLAFAAAAGLAGRMLLGGLADVRAFHAAFGILLQRRLFPDEPGRVVRMGDFGKAGRPDLKIVSANLSRTKLHLFSASRTAATPVADAVAASICLPVVFRPWFIDGDLHVDGGIVSNLPAWPFDEERELDPEALTIAVEVEGADKVGKLGRYSWLFSAVRTGLFGSGELNLRVSGQAERLMLPSSLGLLQFDISKDRVVREVADARRTALLKLDKRLFRRPELYRNACAVTQGLVEDILEAAIDGLTGRVRVAVAIPDRDYRQSLRLRYSIGYRDDPDEGLLVPLEGSPAGQVWRRAQARLEIAPLAASLRLPGPANRLRRKLQWRELAWVFCIPISHPDTGRLRFVVQVDGSAVLPTNATVSAAFDQIERDVTDFFNLIIRELAELEDDDGLAKQ